MGPSRDAVVFMLIKDGKLLVERRRKDKRILPGAVVIPGGRVEAGETFEEAVKREVEEELCVKAANASYLCSQRKDNDIILHYFVVTEWTGQIESKEAEETFWIGLDEEERLDVETGRIALREYRKEQDAKRKETIDHG